MPLFKDRKQEIALVQTEVLRKLRRTIDRDWNAPQSHVAQDDALLIPKLLGQIALAQASFSADAAKPFREHLRGTRIPKIRLTTLHHYHSFSSENGLYQLALDRSNSVSYSTRMIYTEIAVKLRSAVRQGKRLRLTPDQARAIMASPLYSTLAILEGEELYAQSPQEDQGQASPSDQEGHSEQ